MARSSSFSIINWLLHTRIFSFKSCYLTIQGFLVEHELAKTWSHAFQLGHIFRQLLDVFHLVFKELVFQKISHLTTKITSFLVIHIKFKLLLQHITHKILRKHVKWIYIIHTTVSIQKQQSSTVQV